MNIAVDLSPIGLEGRTASGSWTWEEGTSVFWTLSASGLTGRAGTPMTSQMLADAAFIDDCARRSDIVGPLFDGIAHRIDVNDPRLSPVCEETRTFNLGTVAGLWASVDADGLTFGTPFLAILVSSLHGLRYWKGLFGVPFQDAITDMLPANVDLDELRAAAVAHLAENAEGIQVEYALANPDVVARSERVQRGRTFHAHLQTQVGQVKKVPYTKIARELRDLSLPSSVQVGAVDLTDPATGKPVAAAVLIETDSHTIAQVKEALTEMGYTLLEPEWPRGMDDWTIGFLSDRQVVAMSQPNLFDHPDAGVWTADVLDGGMMSLTRRAR